MKPKSFGDHNQRVITRSGEYKIPHPIQRAAERYGIKITLRDLMGLCQQCQVGYGRMSFFPDGSEQHIVMHNGKALVAIYRPHDGSYVRQKEGVILTILPREELRPKHQKMKQWAAQKRVKKRKPKKARKRFFS
jgi:hypothetical protein